VSRGVPFATLSVDFDDAWAYRRSFGIAAPAGAPSLLPIAVPRLRELMAEVGVTATCFLVGRDAEQPANAALLRSIAQAGHRLGNHSYSHDMDLSEATADTLRADLAAAHAAILALGVGVPEGFRSPAFGTTPQVFEAVASLGYRYDASSFPNSLGIVARAYHRRRARALGARSRLKRGAYGGLRAAGATLRPHVVTTTRGALVEFPVTTLPFFRTPIHGTYLHVLADRSPTLARAYFRFALALCAARGVPPSFLLHATDVIGADDAVGLEFLPGMRRPAAEKYALTRWAVAALARRFDTGPIEAALPRFGRDVPAGRLPASGELRP